MPYTIKAACPCRKCKANAGGKCEANAKSLDEVESIFGFRIMGDGGKEPQAYCRKCRGLRCSPNDEECQN